MRSAFATEQIREWRASHIADPIERLRYLRHASAPQEPALRRAPDFRKLLPMCGLLFLLIPNPTPSSTHETPQRERRLVGGTEDAFPKIWLVDKTSSYETYSNGLRIETVLRVSNRPRKPFPIYTSGRPAGFGSAPVGIVFHTTETHLAPFEAEENTELKRLGRSLLDVVRKRQSYHFVIDRFGRIFKIVEEGDIAFHAGWSVWADQQGAYVNLNDSFLGVSFEAQTQGGIDQIQPAQIHAARVLTEMLRARYQIPAANCVTHAQVSVNPQNRRIGYHTDWAANFPFAAIGLPDNYALPVASMYEFGFEYDSVFVQAMGNHLWSGIAAAEQQLGSHATANGVAAPAWKATLQQRFRNIASQISGTFAVQSAISQAAKKTQGEQNASTR